MDIQFINQTSADIPEKALLDFLNDCLLKLPTKDKEQLVPIDELTVVFVGTDQIQQLNKEFRGKDSPTDILSFAPVEEKSLGELIVCVEIIEKQAVEHDLSLVQEYCYMLIHGVLHLLGYDHEKDDTEAERMYLLQDNLFNDYFGAHHVHRN